MCFLKLSGEHHNYALLEVYCFCCCGCWCNELLL